MNFKQIQQFLTIVKYMNLSTAARELYISQPALSLSLARMESALNVRLFFRDGNRLILSPAGEQLLDSFKKLNMDFEHLYDQAALLNTPPPGEGYITVGFSCSALLYAALYMSDFLSSYNGKTIHKLHGDTANILFLLKSQQIDFAVTSPPLEDDTISSRSVVTEPILLVVSNRHPLAKRPFVHFKDLEGLDFVGLNKHNKFRSECDQICARNHFSPNYVIECEYLEQRKIIEESAGSSRYLSFCARDSFSRYYGSGYIAIPIEGEYVSRTTSISWLTERKLQYEYKGMLNHIVQGYPQLYQEHLRLLQIFQAERIFRTNW